MLTWKESHCQYHFFLERTNLVSCFVVFKTEEHDITQWWESTAPPRGSTAVLQYPCQLATAYKRPRGVWTTGRNDKMPLNAGSLTLPGGKHSAPTDYTQLRTGGVCDVLGRTVRGTLRRRSADAHGGSVDCTTEAGRGGNGCECSRAAKRLGH